MSERASEHMSIARRQLNTPRAQPLVGHLGRWGREPLALLEEGAQLGGVFELRLWRRAVVGYSPDWNRFVLGDLSTFRSKGSMSGFSPHLDGGVVQADEPEHRDRRAALNRPFARTALQASRARIADVVAARLPVGSFDAGVWSSAVVRPILNTVFFDGRIPADLLDDFLRPLDRPLPWPFLPRPRLFRRMNQAIDRALPDVPPGCLAAAVRSMPTAVEELRVALSAAYDTTAHTLAWLLYHAALRPDLLEAGRRDLLLNEVLRLYPAGWLGSRRCAADIEFDGVAVPRGRLVLYSPYLTHRDPTLWKEPLEFRPERFLDPLPAWGFIPFAAGPRTCLGSSLARLILDTALEVVATGRLRVLDADPRPRAGITLAPTGPLILNRERVACRT